MTAKGIEIRVKGKVQGVGFRPFVWLLAREHQLCGDVNNDGQGVLIRFVQPNSDSLNAFLQDLRQKLPPLAQITELHQQARVWAERLPENEFLIRESENNAMDTQIVPDAATCPACIEDLFTASNRRFHYPFTNCTHCGPRFTIIKSIPYDRPNTSMGKFPLCPECAKEYKDPADRRFHAQPNACPVCGPEVWLTDNQGKIIAKENWLKQTALLLKNGAIIAIKGIGGFHLACDATNEQAVNLLRQRKHRPSKPLAVMVPDIKILQNLTALETELLTSTAAPILLLHKNKVPELASSIAPNLNEIGVMLPSNPLQHLLLQEMGITLVMTSGNPSGQPPVLDNESAVQNLKNLADFFLCHNRDILQRADDSLVRASFDGLETLRRARGYVPDELALYITSQKQILALGADLKNTFCLLRQNKALISQHIGDTSNEKVRAQLNDNLRLFQQIYQFQPDYIAIDAHSGYYSSELGQQLAREKGIPFLKILHHHAHIMSVMAEHHYHEPVIGLALDGIGMGENGQLWGGECLFVDKQHCQRLGGLPAVAIAGGDLAAQQPWRNWLAHLKQFVPNWQNIAEKTCADYDWQLLSTAIDRGIHSPVISSAGRLFDAVAFGLGIAPQTLSWEGEAACQLEVIATQSSWANTPLEEIQLSVEMPVSDNGILDLATFWQTWLAFDASKADKSFAFHYALAKGFAQLARQQAQIYACSTVVLSGGAMHNQLLRRLLKSQLADFNVLSGQRYPMGDGGLSLGQAVIASYITNE